MEVGGQLSESLEANVSIEGRIGAVPTITPIGMAALLPGADESFVITSAGPGELGAEIGGVLLKDRKGRVNYLKEKTSRATSNPPGPLLNRYKQLWKTGQSGH